MKQSVNLAFYRPEDWQKFQSVADDRENLHETWEEWFVAFEETKSALEDKNLSVRQVTVDIDQLVKYCIMKGLKNTGKTRSQYVSTQ